MAANDVSPRPPRGRQRWFAPARCRPASSSPVPETDRGARLEAERVRVVRAEQALEEADEAERRRGSAARRAGVPIAVEELKAWMSPANVKTLGTGAVDEPSRESSKVGGAAHRGRDRDRQDQPPRACVRDVHRIAHMGNHPQPIGDITASPGDPPVAAGPRWRRDWPRRRERRTAPAPSASAILQAIRPEATARPCATRPAGRALARDVRQRLPDAKRPRHRPAPGRHGRRRPRRPKPPPPERPFADAARESRGSWESPSRPKVARALRRRCWTSAAAARWTRPPNCCAHSVTRSPRAIPITAASETRSPSSTCAASPTMPPRCPTPTGSAGTPASSRGWGGSTRTSPCAVRGP